MFLARGLRYWYDRDKSPGSEERIESGAERQEEMS